ncbi:MAG: DHHA1 domain-containing protein [Deinococcales bacterium]
MLRLLGENQATCHRGFKTHAPEPFFGLKAILQHNKLSEASARDVAFVIAPRINAAGRLGEADKALEMLTTASERRARELAVYLDARNSYRRQLQDSMLEEALADLAGLPDGPAVVIADIDGARDWNPGIMGIVASDILEKLYKPVFIIAKGKGSVRSVRGISAVEGLRYSASELKRFGGHSQAAGFAIGEKNIEAFREKIYEYCHQFPRPQPFVTLDALIGAGEVDYDLFEAMARLEPYGEGHPAPLFALSESISSLRSVGQQGKHLQLRLGDLKGVAWQKGELAKNYQLGQKLHAAISIRENAWQGKKSLEFVAEDLKAEVEFSLLLPKHFDHQEQPNSNKITKGRPPTQQPSLELAEFLSLDEVQRKNLSQSVLVMQKLPLDLHEPLELFKTF